MTYIPAVVVLLFALADLERGECELLGFLTRSYASVCREDSPGLYWFGMFLELLIVEAFFWLGGFIEKALAHC